MPTSTLGAFLGMWEGKGASKDSAYSKAGPNSAQTNCNWSPNHGFLVCDQIVHLPDGVTQNDLSIYTYNETDHSYAFYGLSRNNSRVRTPKLTIEDKRWTYSGEFEDNGKKIRFRTINDFTTPPQSPSAHPHKIIVGQVGNLRPIDNRPVAQAFLPVSVVEPQNLIDKDDTITQCAP